MAAQKSVKNIKIQTSKSAPGLKKKKKAAEPAKTKKSPSSKPSRPPKALKSPPTSKPTIPKKADMKQRIETKPIRNENEPVRQMLLGMRGKLIHETSQTRAPETLVPSSDIGDLVDQAGDERDRELSLLLTGRDKEKLHAIDEALEKLADGTYGICEECGEKIGAGRLRVMPLAKSCVNCQQNLEKELNLQRGVDEDSTYRGLAYASGAEEEEG